MHSHLRVSSFTKMNPRRLWVMALISQRCLPRLILEKCPSVSEMGTLWPSVRPSVLVSRFWRSRVVQRVIIAPQSISPHLLPHVRLILVQTSHASIFQAFPRKTKAHLPGGSNCKWDHLSKPAGVHNQLALTLSCPPAYLPYQALGK